MTPPAGPFQAYTPAAYVFPLPEGHRFPAYKYAGVRDRLSPLLPVLDTPALSWADAGRVHDPLWLRRWRRGEVTRAEERAFGLPWSPGVVERARRAAGGSLAALHDALRVGWGANLAGGTHHAFRDRAEGFCLVNDAAILTRVALDGGVAQRVAVLDLDVHQGNGTAALLDTEPRALTVSVHGERNYPFRKERSSLDLGLPDGVTDAEYLTALRGHVLPALDAFRPDLLLYLAGVDVLAGDRFGRFAMTLDGVRERNRAVLTWARAAGVPVVTMMAGGYNRDHALTVEAHASVVLDGLDVFG
ncbi:acetoin utilization deacetylase AcuC-like enzyme [Deinococcus metalli]|uniref:Acetoin utilization deacetylase AcuC-like enzyme n=1 Tax=Deinococcus metalli TaxID=1141878 RepID=A0A7W8KG48_9DEIO|nr:histone deacetylase [Deinococcus metalli]MBB5377158.1 acetoin utilization deacetylase AcuC-like enzyme [Deinococcus metalli]GHF48553.1 histone deacetylase [Deinococcus metalli]